MRYKIIGLFALLPLLTSCNGDIEYFKGFACIKKYMNYGDKVVTAYYPKESLGIHINSNQKDYFIEYFIQITHIERTFEASNTILDGINVKFTISDNLTYIPEGSYSLFVDKCLLH